MTTITLEPKFSSFVPNQKQKEASLMMDQWINDASEPFMGIVGSSGSGKTTVVANKLREKNLNHVVLTAPTNEALEVLAESIPEYDAKTIYSLLGYRPTATHQEDQIIVRAGSYKVNDVWVDPAPKEIPYIYVILDEGFYTPNQLIEHIYCHHTRIKWLIMGDPEQLKALKDTDSFLARIFNQFKYKIELLEDMRSVCPQQKSRMLLARDQKRNLDLDDEIQSKPEVLREIIQYFNSCDADPKKGGDPMNFDFLALAYHHRVVNKIGKDLRDYLFRISPDTQWQPGEIIRVSEVIDGSLMQLVRTNERVRVLNYNYDQVFVERGNGEQIWLPIDHTGICDYLYNAAKESFNAKEWAIYHKNRRQYVKISSPIALTAHSAQGRTAKRCLVDIRDIFLAQDDGLFYVALGRSRELAWLVEGW